MMLINSIPLKEPLLKAYLGASHIIKEANIHGDLQGLEWFNMPFPSNSNTLSCGWCTTSFHLPGLCKFPIGVALNT